MQNHFKKYLEQTSPENHEKYLKDAKNYVGITWDKTRSLWEVKIKSKRIGRFPTFHQAVIAKNSRADVYFDRIILKWAARKRTGKVLFFDSFGDAAREHSKSTSSLKEDLEVNAIASETGVSVDMVLFWMAEKPELFRVLSVGVNCIVDLTISGDQQ